MPRWANRLVKAGIIAAVLGTVGGTGWLAGHGAASPEPPADDLPAPNLAPKPITVGKGEIVSRLTVDAVVRADPGTPVRTTKPGAVAAIYRKNGQKVTKGQSILAIKVPGKDDGKGKKGKPRLLGVPAPASGTVTGLNAAVGQEINPSEPFAEIDRGRFQAVATIDGKEVYRLYNRPEEVRLAIDHGPSPFRCKLLAYGAGASNKGGKDSSGGSSGGSPDGGGGPQGGGDGGSGGSGGDNVEVTCRIPSSQRVFAGIRGKMAITTDSVHDAVVIPLSAVLGENDKGRVTVVGDDGRRQIRKIKLGINDGKQVEVVDGLNEGDKILDRAPDDPAFDVPGRSDGDQPPGGGEAPPDGGLDGGDGGDGGEVPNVVPSG
jgi:macrolide-specific efflux system membrane fusion protein